MVFAEFDESGRAFRFGKGDKGKHSERLWNEDVRDLTILRKILLKIFLRYVLRHATDENATAQVWLRGLEEKSARARWGGGGELEVGEE